MPAVVSIRTVTTSSGPEGSEGSRAAPPRSWTIAERDAFRQEDHRLGAVRAGHPGRHGRRRRWHSRISTGRGSISSGRRRIDARGRRSLRSSQMSMRASRAFSTGLIPEHLRWQPARRPEVGTALQSRTPSLLNAVDGLTGNRWRAVLMPYFNENKPLRDQPIVINDVPGGSTSSRRSSSRRWSPKPACHQRCGRAISGKPRFRGVLPSRSSICSPKVIARPSIRAPRCCFARGIWRIARSTAVRIWRLRRTPGFPKEPHAFLVNTGAQVPMLSLRMVALSAQEWIGLFSPE